MTTTVDEHAQHETPHGHAGPPRRRGILMRPGYVRAAWCTAAFFLIGMYIVVTLRWLAGWDPVYDWEYIVLIAGMVAAPLGFLLGIGAFDYWLYWISGRPTVADDHANHGAYKWTDYFKVNTDHKVIGVQYLVTTFFFFIVGGFLAMLFRAELAQPGMQFFDTQTFNGLVSAHATLMIFVFIIPAFAGLANFAVPLMLGAPDMAFPRLNALSFWMLPIAGVLFLASFLAPGGAFATGWTSYAPLASEQPFGQVFFNMGVQWAGASSIATALNFLVTIITMRAPGMTFWRMPLLVWANFTTSLLVVIATPFIAGSQFFVMFDRVMHTSFFIPDNGGYVLGYQHIFWFYSHPAVYIMILPGFGIISEIVSVMSRKPIFGYRLMAISLLGILVLGFSVWAHHMFVAGMADWLRVPMMISTLLIAVPTGVKVFSWLATLWEGKIHLNTPMLFALGFISMFVIGGLSGIYLASVPIDIHASDTYFIVAHIHYVLFGGSVFTIFAGIYYWFPKMTGRMYNERLGKLHFWITFVAFNVTFFPMHWVGLVGMPRRVADYAGTFGALNMVDLDRILRAGRVGRDLRLQRDHELGARADRRVEPVEGDDDRVAGLVAAAGVQLRRDPAGRRRPVRVRGAGCEARRPEGRRVAGGATVSETEPTKHVLVVANETLAGDELVDAVRTRAEQGPIRTVVIAPVNEPSARVRRLPQLAARVRGQARGQDGGRAARRGDPRARRRLRGRPDRRRPGRARARGRRRADRLDPSRADLRLAAEEERPRRAPPAGRRPTVPARRLRRRRPHRPGERARRRQRDRPRRPAARPDPAAGGGRARRLPDRLPAERPRPGRAPRGRAAPARRAHRAARRGHRGARADRPPRPVHRHDAGDRGRAGRRGDHLHLPGRALRMAQARRRRAAAQGRGRPRRARRRRRPGTRGGGA